MAAAAPPLPFVPGRGGKSYNLALDRMSPYMHTMQYRQQQSDNGSERTMPVCFTPEQLQLIEEYAKSRGMLNASQAIEELARGSN